jgi:hypothetical protein
MIIAENRAKTIEMLPAVVASHTAMFISYLLRRRIAVVAASSSRIGRNGCSPDIAKGPARRSLSALHWLRDQQW